MNYENFAPLVAEELERQLRENDVGLSPRSYIVAHKPLNDGDGVKFVIRVHQINTWRDGKLVTLAPTMWYFSMQDAGIWDTPLGQAGTREHIRDLVKQISRHVRTTEPITLS